MGCGESKHALATENTISKSKRSNSKKNIEEKPTIGDVIQSNIQDENGNNAEKAFVEGSVKGVEKVYQNVKENQDQPLPKVEVKEDGNKEEAAAPVVVEAAVKEGEGKKEVKEEIISVQSTEEKGVKMPVPDESKKVAPEKETASNEVVVEENELTKEIKTEAKNDEVVEDQKEIKETKEEEQLQSAEAKDSANTAQEKIPSAKQEIEIEIESSEKDQKAI